jgi:chaperonin GroEL
MAARKIHFADDLRDGLLRGVMRVARTAELTLGSDARTVLIGDHAAPPRPAASGYDVALAVDGDCPLARMGVQAMRNLAWEMGDRWSDGTATAISVAAAMFDHLCMSRMAGRAGDEAEREIRALVKSAREFLENSASPVADRDALLLVARSAAGGDEAIAGKVADAAAAVGAEGYVEVTAGDRGDELEIVPAMQFETGLLSRAFETDRDGRKAVLENVHIVVFDGRIEDFGAIGPMLDVFARMGKPLLFVASALAQEAVDVLAAYVRRSGARIAAVQAPQEGDWKRWNLGDIAAGTGATVFGDERGYCLSHVKPELVGFAERAEIDGRRMCLIGGRADPEALAFRKGLIEGDIRAATYLSLDRERHRRRLARLGAGVATLRVGAAFHHMRDWRLARARQAAGAVAASRSRGMIDGGGRGLRRAGMHFGSPVGRALAAPFRALAANGGNDRCGGRLAGDGPVSAIGLRDPCAIVVDAIERAAATALLLATADVSITTARQAGSA